MSFGLCALVLSGVKNIFRYQDPFEEYKTRLARKLAHQTELASKPKETQQKDVTNDMNWFGMKLGSNTSAVLGADGGEVGKYLDLKRPRQSLSTLDGPQEKKKQKTLGFGDFSSW